jgi:DMSO/TMAO reductase YedYZ heme-binding membrane subunit
MTTMTNSFSANNRFFKLLAFLLSLLLGIIGGGIVMVTGWFLLTRTPLAAHLSTLLGITDKTPWYFSRSAGTVAYLLLVGSTVWGLLLSTKIIKEMVPAALVLAMHNILSWLAVAFTGVHALALMFDNYFTYTLPDLTVPFIGPYQPGWVGLGIIGFYLMLLTSISFQFRKQIGQKQWRRIHYLTYVVFILATIHGLMAGTDSGKPGMQVLYLGSGLLVFFLTSYRLLTRNMRRITRPV